MAKIVKELLTKWTYKVDSRQLKATATLIKNLHKSMMQVRSASIGFEKGEVDRLRRIKNGWRGVNQEVQSYKRNLQGARGPGGRPGQPGGRRSRRQGILGNQSTAFLAGNVLKSPIIGSALLAAGGNPAILGGLAVAGGLAKSIGAASRKQQAEVGLQTFATAEAGGDAEKGRESTKKFMGELNTFAKNTPFGVSQLRDLALRMKGFGFATKEVIPVLSQLGDLTGGRMDVLQRMIVNMAQIRNLGKAQTVDLKQIANAGIPIQQKLAKMLDKNIKTIQAMIPKGQITSAHIAQAFKEMTSAGGMFFEQQKKRSATLGGQWEKLKENITLVGEAVGDPFLTPMTAALRLTNRFVDSIMALTKAVSGGFGDLFGAAFDSLSSIPGFDFQVKILKALGAGLLFANPLTGFLIILEDIGAFFDGKESFFGDFMEWLGGKEGEGPLDILIAKYRKIRNVLKKFVDDLWDDLTDPKPLTMMIANMDAQLVELDKWFEASALGKFIESVFGRKVLEFIRAAPDTAPVTAPPTGPQTTAVPGGARADNRSQNVNIHVNPGGVGEAVTAATDRGILNTSGRQFQSQFVV